MRVASLVWGAVILSLSVFGSLVMAADSPRGPYQIVSELRDRMYVVGETTGKQQDFVTAVEHARQELQDYAASGRAPAAYLEKGANGATPLTMAADAGYGEIVAELLTNKNVTESVNEVDEHGFSPWVYANFALQEAIWVCNPTVLKDPFKFVTRLVTLPYYTSGAERPYAKTRRVLEEAGAKADMAAAKKLWLDTCKLATADMQAKVSASDDLLATIETENTQFLAKILAQKKPVAQ